jgi:hypothetical protein
MYLIFALFWLMFGVALLVRQAISGDPGWSMPVGEYRVSWGWLMMVLVVYNLARWWSVRSARAARRRQSEPLIHRQDVPANRDPEPPNPDFDFTDKTLEAPRPETRVSERPGGTT